MAPEAGIRFLLAFGMPCMLCVAVADALRSMRTHKTQKGKSVTCAANTIISIGFTFFVVNAIYLTFSYLRLM